MGNTINYAVNFIGIFFDFNTAMNFMNIADTIVLCVVVEIRFIEFFTASQKIPTLPCHIIIPFTEIISQLTIKINRISALAAAGVFIIPKNKKAR